MSKFENVLKAQKVRTTKEENRRRRRRRRRQQRAARLSFSSFVPREGWGRGFFSFYPKSGKNILGSSSFHRENDLIFVSLTLSSLFSIHTARKRQFYQQQHKHVHLKGTTDMISSVAIPLAMTASAFGMLAMGLKDLATGSNKKPGF